MTRAEVPRPDHAARRDRLRAGLGANDADRLLVTDPANVRYLSGFAGSNGQVLVALDPGGDRLVTDDRYAERAAVEAPDLDVIVSRDPFGVALGEGAGAADGGDVGAGALGWVRALAVEADHLTWHAAERLRVLADESGTEVVATTGLVAALRAVKDDHELDLLARACAITTAALEELIAERVAPGASEHDLAVWLERRFVDLGADGVAFPSIVASGPNGAVPHHAPTRRELVDGDLVTIDCGALLGGYHADCTRTVAVGAAGGELVEVHALVERAQAAGRTAAVAGATSGEVDRAARSVIEEAGYGEAFVHGTGHGVGLEIHEAPAVARGAAATLQPGTALTVEPGVYLPGTGGVRIEDTIVVTADGAPRALTDTPRSLRLR
ncbi:MAG: Xaa-Pro peptidase family protein [Nitriliruptor sp.]